MSENPDLTACDREPIHVPGSIQPHGVMLVARRSDLVVVHGAGEIEGRLGESDWCGAALNSLIGGNLAGAAVVAAEARSGYVGRLERCRELFDVSAHLSGAHLIVELEPANEANAPAAMILARLSAAAASFERAATLEALCQQAARAFRDLTGFDRVMIYQFIEESAGAVVAEDKVDELPSFMRHHFPGTDIPRQARALYVRNLVRVIPDVTYDPQPLRPAWAGPEPLDMSDAVLRSVSPIHMQYMRNMGVAASASVSIVKDGVLWGLVACHHRTPKGLAYDVRAACAALAGGLARQVRAKEEAALYRERIRLRSQEDRFIDDLAGGPTLDQGLATNIDELARVLRSDGAASVRAGEVLMSGATPGEMAVRRLADWMLAHHPHEPFATDALATTIGWMADFREIASGLLAVVVSADEPFVLMWFRAEQVQVIEWAGNPHKDLTLKPGESLSPRASFEAWGETVRGRARRWSLPEIEAASRLRQGLTELRHRQQLLDLNKTLRDAVAAKDGLIEQKEFLLREVNHRVQNSLQLVSSFLGLQSRATENLEVQAQLHDAQQRLNAVALVHRRLYRSDQIEIVDLARYIEELTGELKNSIGEEWSDHIALDLAPVMLSTDRAVTVGLVLTELVINANKYAYGGRPGPICISLEAAGPTLRVVVADSGKGNHSPGKGFGTRMMTAMVGQLQGELTYIDNEPGLRAVLTFPANL
ncbi:histidine kinase dimerization/phosphoacceptor domain -containing protein [Phenylobacterium immobile]|uniref:histidine kinase dimerization/phosphoacceptor domain -containing protein n=1 Tax=Phenylobacterium immobile TaxID=21 RepID=UPI000A4D90F0|nr:histidine kinase dimerization/phosphoacceptor domain -containing protein [Phenylobacterium immobile]